MKNFIFTCSMCLISVAVFSQERISVSKTPQTLQVNKSEVNNAPRTINPEPVESKEEVLKKIAQIDSHIEAINIKTEYVLNDPSQKIIAEQEGWFEDMRKTKESLELKKQELIHSIEK